MQNSKPQIVEKFKMTYIIALREFTSVQYGQKYLLKNTFLHLFMYGEGGWYYNCDFRFHNLRKLGCYCRS